MKQITFYFDKDKIDLNYPTQKGTECIPLADIGPQILALLQLPASITELTLDYIAETIVFRSSFDLFIHLYPGLSKKEQEINKLLGYESIDASNLLGLSNALLNGLITREEFDSASIQECQTSGPNPSVTKFLESL